MDSNGFRLVYFQIEKCRRKKGFSSWWLGGCIEADEFPSDAELKSIFRIASSKGNLLVESRGANHRIILLPLGVSKAVRQKFLLALAK